VRPVSVSAVAGDRRRAPAEVRPVSVSAVAGDRY